MLVDFLKENHLLKSIAIVPWLWITKGLVILGPERWVSRGASGRSVWYKYFLIWQLFVGPGLLGRPGGWMVSEMLWTRRQGGALSL
jgi:hypothetical protein